MTSSLSVVILAAGRGTRMRSSKAKVLHSLGGIPFVAHPIHTVQELNPERVVLVIGYQGEAVQTELNARFGEDALMYAWQHEQNGTAHAVLCAKEELMAGPEQILLVYGDVPLLSKPTLDALVQGKQERGAKISMISFMTNDPTGYGRILRDADDRVLAIREHRDCTPEERLVQECNAGIYLFDRDYLFSAFDRIKSNNDQGEYYLTDVVELAVNDGFLVDSLVLNTDGAVEVMGANDRSQVAQLETKWLQERRQEIMESGVTLTLPESIYVEYDVVIEPDTEIGPHVVLKGNTRIGSGSVIGAGCVLTNAIVPPNTILPPYTVQEG